MEILKKFFTFVFWGFHPYKLSWGEQVRIWRFNRRRPSAVIDMEELYQILGQLGDVEHYVYLKENKREENHPVDGKTPQVIGGNPIEKFDLMRGNFNWDTYIKRVEEKSKKYSDHIVIEQNPTGEFIPETGGFYRARAKITIKNMTINVPTFERDMYFYSPSDSSKHEGVYFVFENNHFVGKSIDNRLKFHMRDNFYFAFRNNKFDSGSAFLSLSGKHNSPQPGMSKIEFKDNVLENSSLSTLSVSHPPKSAAILSMDNNTLYRNDNIPSYLGINLDCYFNGKNTVDSLFLGSKKLYWGGRQNIDPQGNHAYTHMPLFIGHMNSTDDNDKMQKVKLRRELSKCERVFLGKENFWDFLQDKIIIWWIWLISDYGTLCIRPIIWLFGVNFTLSLGVYALSETEASFGYLFGEFFNPLSDLSETSGVKENGWISFFNAAQKAFFAAVVYEAIKIFRRFSAK